MISKFIARQTPFLEVCEAPLPYCKIECFLFFFLLITLPIGSKHGVHVNFVPKFKLLVEPCPDGSTIVKFDYYGSTYFIMVNTVNSLFSRRNESWYTRCSGYPHKWNLYSCGSSHLCHEIARGRSIRSQLLEFRRHIGQRTRFCNQS